MSYQVTWIPTSERKPKHCVPVMGFSNRWIDLDFNPKGQRECFLMDEGYWITSYWNNYQDCYQNMEDQGGPEYYFELPPSP